MSIETETIQGWIITKRKQNNIIFLEVNDGSNVENTQVTIHKDKFQDKTLEPYNFYIGEYIKANGNTQKCPEEVAQDTEFVVKDIISYGGHIDNKYPINRKTTLVNLREISHLRSRTRLYGAVFRIRNTIMMETHKFYQDNGFLLTDPNMITTNECEGGAGVFTVTEIAKAGQTIKNFKKDHFKKQAFLTVSSQLQLEAMCCGLGNVYTVNRSFRSEHSSTSKHLSEFTHLEIEMNNIQIESLINISTKFIQHIIKTVYNKHTENGDLQFLSKTPHAKDILNTYNTSLLNLKFFTKTYDEIYSEMCKLRESDESVPCFTYGEDLSSEIEKWIVEHYGGAVFVSHWPENIKSFYMRLSRENKNLVENFDLLMPNGVGELIGGSMREEKYDLLKERMHNMDVDEKGLEWYLDLRKYGTVKHGGFGLGLERLMMLCTGMPNIKDVIPFPNSYQSCNF